MTSLHLSPDLALPLDAVTQKFAVLAQSGAGKTYTAMKLAEEMLRARAQVVGLDPVGVWWGLRVGQDGKAKGFDVVIFGGAHADIPITDKSGALVAQAIAETKVSAVIDVSELTTAESTRFVADFAEGLLHAKKKHASAMHLFMEEAQLFAPQNPEPSEGKMLNRVERLLKIGRNFGVGWTLVSQQPQAVHKRCLNQAGCLLALRTLGKHEKKAITEWVSDKARSDAELDLLRNLPSLETGEAFVWSPSWLKVAKQVKIGKKHTFDSSATPEVGVAVKAAPKITDLGAMVEDLHAMLRHAQQDAEANDPEVLKARIKELERLVEAKPIESLRTIYAVPPALGQLLHDVAKGTFDVEARIREANERLGFAVGELERLKRLHAQLTGFQLAPEGATVEGPSISAAMGNATHPQRVRQNAPAAPPAPRPKPPPPAPVRDDDGGLNRGARAILVAVASRKEHPTRHQTAVLAGLTPSSGTFQTYLSQLRQGGYLTDNPDKTLTLTARGVAYLDVRGLLPKRAATTAELLALWEEKFDGGAKAMLRTLVGLGRVGVLSRDALAQAVGLTPGSGTFGTYLSQLNAAGLIVKHHGGTVGPSPTFFP